MRLGILGGTFNPIHIGHLMIAKKAKTELKLNSVLFIPAGNPWMKSGREIASPLHRVNMVKLATSKNRAFDVSELEIERPGPTYTIDTLEHLRRNLLDTDTMFLILGSDSYRHFNRWNRCNDIFKLCEIVIAERPGMSARAMPGASQANQQRINGPIYLDGPMLEISGKDIRRRVAEGKTIRGQVPRKVEKYIYDKGLYSYAGDVP